MTDEHGLQELSELLEAVAYQAGLAILDIMRRGAELRDKRDGSPVTDADTRSEALILKALGRHCPDIPVVAEEAAGAGQTPHAIGNRFFLVDPLDGTREFIDGNGDFTVNIALIEDARPVCGVVYAPARGEMYLGYRDCAWFIDQPRERGNERQTISVRPPGGRTIAVASRSHRTIETERYLAERGITDYLAIGSSLKFCMLARGQADLYPRFGRTMEWDTAAGDAVLRAAGGMTVTIEDRPLAYGKQEQGFVNPNFIARTTR